MTIALHLSRAVFIRILAVALAFAGLAMALDLVESANTVLSRGDGGIFRYLALRFPLILAAVLPVAMIMGPVLAFLTLAGRNEFTILRAAGVTTYRMLVCLLPLGILMGVGFHLLVDRAAPRLQAQIDAWLSDTPEATSGGFWARTTNSVVRVGASSPNGEYLKDLDIYETDRTGRMLARTDAAEATYEDKGVWRLGAASRLIPGSSESIDASGETWETPLAPDNVRALAAPGRGVAGDVANKVLAGDWAGNRSDAFYQVRFYRGYAALLTPMLMILLAIPAAYGMRRAAGFGRSAAWAVVLGFGYLLVDGMLASLGESGNMPPILAAFGGAVIFGAVGGWALLALEE